TRVEDVLGRGDVAVDRSRFEPGTLIVDVDLEAVRIDLEHDVDRLRGVLAMGVLDGVGARLDHRHRDLRAGALVQLHAAALLGGHGVEQSEQLEAARNLKRDLFGGCGGLGHEGTQCRWWATYVRSNSSAPVMSCGRADVKRSRVPVIGWSNSSSDACRAWRG